MKKCAIYMILCSNGHFYFGSTNCVKRRFQEHKNGLKGNRHDNHRMQHCWNKYGEESFTFKHLVDVPEEHRDEVEQKVLDWYFDHPNCMNLNPIAEHPAYYVPTDEDIAKMAHVDPILVSYVDGTTETFVCVKHTAKKFGVSREALRDYINKNKGKRGWYKQKNIPTKMQDAGVVEVTKA